MTQIYTVFDIADVNLALSVALLLFIIIQMKLLQ